MNTPNEIKKGLACYAYEMKCGDRSCKECPYDDHPYGGFDEVAEDALLYIQQLEADRVCNKDILPHYCPYCRAKIDGDVGC
jgi:hypothetical protein